MRSRWFGLVVAALAVAMSVWAYPQLPPAVATHWNLNGTPDGFSSRLWALAIVPIARSDPLLPSVTVLPLAVVGGASSTGCGVDRGVVATRRGFLLGVRI